MGYDIPLNQGCLIPVTVKIPKGSVLDPHPGAAVIGGNVCTSQRIVDVIFSAFSTCAASQVTLHSIFMCNFDLNHLPTDCDLNLLKKPFHYSPANPHSTCPNLLVQFLNEVKLFSRVA